MTTDKCIVCLEKAQYFSGHVLKDGKKITAGFCSSEHMVSVWVTGKRSMG